MYLLDTPILFELRKAKAGGSDAQLAAWAGGVARERLFLSALTLAELESAATRLAPTDKSAAAALRAWIGEQVVPAFAGHVLPIDVAVARRRGQVALDSERNALLAATAIEHGLILVTFDKAGFKGVRIKLFDPRSYAPEAADDDADWRTAGRSGPLWLRNLFIRG